MPRDTDHVADIVSAARWIQSYVSGVSREQFDNEPMRQDAVLRQIMIIGEAIRRLSEDFRVAHADIPWRDIVAMRNVVIHAYDRVDLDELWRVANREVTALADSLEPLLPPPPED